MIRQVGLIVVRIISVTRFSFSSSVEVSIWLPSSRISEVEDDEVQHRGDQTVEARRTLTVA